MFDTLEERVSHLTGPLRQWASTDLGTVPAGVVPGRVEALLTMRDMLDGEIMREVAVADRSGEAGLLAGPNGSTAAWLCDVRRMDHNDAGVLVRTARKLSDLLPQTAAALSEGEISYAHAKVLARAVTSSRAKAAEAGYGGGMAQAEKDLGTVAMLGNPAKLAETVTSWAHALDPEPVARKQEEQYAARELYLSRTFEGMLDIKGHGDAASGRRSSPQSKHSPGRRRPAMTARCPNAATTPWSNCAPRPFPVTACPMWPVNGPKSSSPSTWPHSSCGQAPPPPSSVTSDRSPVRQPDGSPATRTSAGSSPTDRPRTSTSVARPARSDPTPAGH